ncbi:MAG: hypothetical protein KIT16_16845, partial [Rhodospirillaceae bacterium]|nr:hypothetical protein [Rhodospirillaceae bacterium]
GRITRSAPPPPPPAYRVAAPPPPPPSPPRRPPARSAFYSNCTQQCHLSCEASFEACNGDASPAKAACVRKLESCRTERCACSFQ